MIVQPTFLRKIGTWAPEYGWQCNNSDSNKHKDEFSTIILYNSKGRFALRKKTAIMFPSITSHITSNIISLHDANLDRAVEIGITFMQTFKANRPEGFLDPITKQIITFAWVGKLLKLGTETLYDPAVIYGRVLGIQSSFRSNKIKDILVHELALLATAMFHFP